MKSQDRLNTPPRTMRIGGFFGVDLLIRPSLLLMAAVLVVLFAPRFEGSTTTNPYVLAMLFVVALYVSVLIHELAHVVVARAYRMHVPSVTLHLLGGETAIEGDSRTPAQEFWTSVVGPLASIAIAYVAWLAAAAVPAGNAADVLRAVAYVNAVVGLMNLVPGMPLDGGRVFRALVWAVSGNKAAATTAAAWAGRLIAVVVVALPFLWAYSNGSSRLAIDLVLAILISAFLWTGASQALNMASRDRRLDHLSARSLADLTTDIPRDVPTLPADLSGADLLRAMAALPSDIYRLVESDGSTWGLLAAESVDEACRKGQT
ncbi:MAG: site-2 protease family protein [Propionibacteriales bacterium]|nr:site-2 protease family protein [Propionibacteriales bacterium]